MEIKAEYIFFSRDMTNDYSWYWNSNLLNNDERNTIIHMSNDIILKLRNNELLNSDLQFFKSMNGSVAFRVFYETDRTDLCGRPIMSIEGLVLPKLSIGQVQNDSNLNGFIDKFINKLYQNGELQRMKRCLREQGRVSEMVTIDIDTNKVNTITENDFFKKR